MSLSQYNAIGFDLDLTLASYKTLPLMEFTFNHQISYLINDKNYPLYLKDISFKENLDLIERGTILDINKGILLQLSKNGEVACALQNGNSLNEHEIVALYGSNKTPLFYDEINIEYRNSKNFRIFDDFFTVQCVPLLNELFKYVATNNVDKKPQEIWEDVVDSFGSIYRKDSSFNKEFAMNMDLYLYTISSELIDKLNSLSEEKLLFIVTSSPEHYARKILNHVFSGKNWEDYFTYIIFDARKPAFFNNQNLFLSHANDMQQTNSPNEEKIFSRGCHEILDSWLKQKVDDPKVLYIGDSLQCDVFPVTSKSSWSACGIVNEKHPSCKYGKGKYHDNKTSLWYHLMSQRTVKVGCNVEEILDHVL